MKEWTEEEEQALNKYFKIYKELEDVLYLTAGMLSNKTPKEVAQKLHELKLVNDDFLYSHFPDLEIESTENYGSDVNLVVLRCHSILNQLPNQSTLIFKWILQNLKEAIFLRELNITSRKIKKNEEENKENVNHEPSKTSTKRKSSVSKKKRGKKKSNSSIKKEENEQDISISDDSFNVVKAHLVIPCSENENLHKNRLVSKLLKALQFELNNDLWTLPSSVSIEELNNWSKTLQSFEERSKTIQTSTSKEDLKSKNPSNKKRSFSRDSNLIELSDSSQAKLPTLFDLFSSPDHKRTKYDLEFSSSISKEGFFTSFSSNSLSE